MTSADDTEEEDGGDEFFDLFNEGQADANPLSMDSFHQEVDDQRLNANPILDDISSYLVKTKTDQRHVCSICHQ